MVDVGMAQRADWGARWRASLWDYLAILGWIAVVTVLGLVVRAALPLPAAGSTAPLVVVDLIAFASTVLPVWAYLTLGEAGRAAATWGKRRTGLRVVGPRDERPGLPRVAVRNAVKLLPWQLAHVAVARLVLGSDDVVTVVVPYVLSLLIPVVTLVVAWRDPLRRAVHDRVAGTRVVRS